MKTVETFLAQIYVGRKNIEANYTVNVGVLHGICQDYTNEFNICVTFTETEYIYVNGSEPGIVVGLINYPRFPLSQDKIQDHALELARRLKKAAGQKRVSVVFDGETVMLGK